MIDLLKNNDAKISVIVPVYNSNKSINQCINSIVNQDYLNIEIIVIDDGSTDNSLVKIRELSEQDNRIIVLSQKNNGVSSARNLGISVATGDYISFVDSDDIIDKNYLSSMLSVIGDVDVVFSGFCFVYKNKVIFKKKQRLAAGYYDVEKLKNKLIDDGTISGILFGSSCTALYKTSIIKEKHIRFVNNIRKNEDGLFNIEYLLKSKYVRLIDNYGYLYSQWNKNTQFVEFSLCEYKKVDKVLLENAEHFDNFSIQCARRRISELFWESYKIVYSNESVLKLSRKLHHFCEDFFSINDYRCLNFALMSIPKRILIWLMAHKLYFVYSLVLKYMIPLLRNKIHH